MYNKKLKILPLLLYAGLLFLNNSFAETIVLKSGKTIEGKIVNRTNEYTEVDFMDVKLKYFNDQIEQIKETKSATETTTPQEPVLISIKIKNKSANIPKKEDADDFISKLESINTKIDSIVSERMSKVFDAKAEKITDQQYESIKNVINLTKEKIAEVEKMKTPPSCKLLKEIFLQKCKARINGLDQLLAGPLPPGEVSKIFEKQNREISEISKKYTEERQRILEEGGIKP